MATSGSKKLMVKLSSLNEHFQCGICQGYIIDATTIAECSHSFCKSCLLHFLYTIEKQCPTCASPVEPNDRHALRYDAMLQRLIYKLVPDLLKSEIERRERFVAMNLLANPRVFDTVLNSKSVINVKLSEKQHHTDSNTDTSNNQARTPRYIQCLAETPVRVLTKLLRCKYDIPSQVKIKMSHQNYQLAEAENFMQIMTTFGRGKSQLLHIRFEIVLKRDEI